LPLGMMPTASYSDDELVMQPGDVVIFYTDGIIEADNHAEEMYGIERLLQTTAKLDLNVSSEEIMKSVFQDVIGFVGHKEQYDDMTIVVIKKLKEGAMNPRFVARELSG